MKKYIKPTFECIEIRTEERLATNCLSSGSCTREQVLDLNTLGLS